MSTSADAPRWNPDKKSASIRQWSDYLYKQAKDMFIKDGTHLHVLFSFSDSEGLISVNPVPPKTTHEQITEGILGAIAEYGLYGMIHIGEVWTYFPRGKGDHTAFQLNDGEIRVSELNDGDKTEALYLRMESREGDCVVYLNRIIRTGDRVELGGDRGIPGEALQWFR